MGRRVSGLRVRLLLSWLLVWLFAPVCSLTRAFRFPSSSIFLFFVFMFFFNSLRALSDRRSSPLEEDQKGRRVGVVFRGDHALCPAFGLHPPCKNDGARDHALKEKHENSRGFTQYGE